MSSVVPETAIPAAVELLRSNQKFGFPSGTAWAMLLLTSGAVGGLSKRHSRDEAKGSIIELINSDQIQTFATAEMLEEEAFGIIPTEATLERMSEYSLLTDARYGWAVVWQEPSGDVLIEPAKRTTFAQAKAVVAGTVSLREAVGERAWAEHSGHTEGEDTGDTDSTGATEAVTVVADDDPIFDPISGDDLEIADTGGEPIFEDFVDDEPAFDDGPDARADDLVIGDIEPGVEVDNEPSIDEHDDTINGFDQDAVDGIDRSEREGSVLLSDQDQVREVIARRFMSEELDLDVRLDEFNTSFAIGAPVVQIAVPEGATEWLGDQVAQLNRQANADLAQQRLAHEDELRALYLNLMSAHIEQVIRALAIDRDGSQYKALKDAADAEHKERLSQKADKIRARKSEIALEYEARAKKHAELAAIQAELQYKERNRSKMDREQVDAIAQIDKDIENDYSHKQREILRVRRQHAMLKMQTGQTRIFEVLAEHQQKHLTAEQDCLDKWKVEIQNIIDENRKADIARANALATHYQTTDEVSDLRREHEARLESVRTQHAERIGQLKDELEHSRKDAALTIQNRDAQWQRSLNLETQRADSQAARLSQLFMQVQTAEESVQRRYAAKITELEDDRVRAWELHERSKRLLVLLMAVLGVLCIVAGFIVGITVTVSG